MKPNPEFLEVDLEFWANVKLLNQRLGYTERKSTKNPNPGFRVPTVAEIKRVFKEEELRVSKLVLNNSFTEFGQLLIQYMSFRGQVLMDEVKPMLMNKDEAGKLFYQLKEQFNPSCPLPMNKQKNEKRDYAFLTGIVNMIIERYKGDLSCDYDPRELTAMTANNFPVRTLSRRVDGAFPSIIDPVAVWEIKEYYYTTTFGSRVADGVYETQLDGWELQEAREALDRNIDHYLIIDDYNTWWNMGRSYLCRIIDLLHMGLVTEVLFGREVVDRLPDIVQKWTLRYGSEGNEPRLAAEP